MGYALCCRKTGDDAFLGRHKPYLNGLTNFSSGFLLICFAFVFSESHSYGYLALYRDSYYSNNTPKFAYAGISRHRYSFRQTCIIFCVTFECRYLNWASGPFKNGSWRFEYCCPKRATYVSFTHGVPLAHNNGPTGYEYLRPPNSR